MDELDRAQALEAMERAACISAAVAAKPKGNGICIDCQEAVEAERSSSLRCLSCQQDDDKRQLQRTGKRTGGLRA
ncbi:hypothetical protein MJ923_14865 [Shewanella sp. 3B26]|uniref:DksA C4-type domain-containing protein n=1 Tax=Shewanella zhuhaiensis TaxID=2919576 RepID=A0AAJ1BIY0_9GAMM|nr:hypothetical protein [Shewanella zhuhaiensis]MCH4295588.1 hypothetical protein [Shewanella zhuhaiensis]